MQVLHCRSAGKSLDGSGADAQMLTYLDEDPVSVIGMQIHPHFVLQKAVELPHCE